jgi:hypothetical protein
MMQEGEDEMGDGIGWWIDRTSEMMPIYRI